MNSLPAVCIDTRARSYRDLKSAGIAEGQERHGTFIASGASVDLEHEISNAVRAFALRIQQLGI